MQFSSCELRQNRLSEGHSLLRDLNSCPYFHTFTVGVLWNSVWGVCSQCCSTLVSLWTSEQLGPVFLMDVNEIMFVAVPWGTPCAVLLHSARQTPKCGLSAGSVLLLPSHGTEGITSQPSESTAVCQLEIHCTAFNKFTQSLYVWIKLVNFTNACVLYH